MSLAATFGVQLVRRVWGTKFQVVYFSYLFFCFCWDGFQVEEGAGVPLRPDDRGHFECLPVHVWPAVDARRRTPRAAPRPQSGRRRRARRSGSRLRSVRRTGTFISGKDREREREKEITQ